MVAHDSYQESNGGKYQINRDKEISHIEGRGDRLDLVQHLQICSHILSFTNKYSTSDIDTPVTPRGVEHHEPPTIRSHLVPMTPQTSWLLLASLASLLVIQETPGGHNPVAGVICCRYVLYARRDV